jgi:hypothetical protein
MHTKFSSAYLKERPHGRPGCRLEDILTMYPKGCMCMCKGVEWIHLAQDRD